QFASCLGNCGAAPMALIGDDTYGTIDPEQTLDLLGKYKLEEDEPPVETEEIKAE
ncbi:MAG: NAD(P)H-dependent oxidoreductase subunit E, partial [Nitrospinae bacterium]|nr:NAD(P)H-dependent oxidoreductase subunit E [Nitrospinota bacterium]